MTDVDDLQLAWHAMDLLGAKTESDWTSEMGKVRHESDFLLNGFHLIKIPEDVVPKLFGFFDKSLVTTFDDTESNSGYFASVLPSAVVKRLNSENIYYGPPKAETCIDLSLFLKTVSTEVEFQLGYRWRVINVRAWETLPKGSIGPNAWHADGFSQYVRKIMLYLQPPNASNGTIEFCDRAGKTIILQSPCPVGLLFESSTLIHRGRPSATSARPMIEITIMPSDATSTDYVYAGQNARSVRSMPSEIVDYLKQFVIIKKTAKTFKQRLKSYIPSFLRTIYSRIRTPASLGLYGIQNPSTKDMVKNNLGRLNLGGGPTFSHPGWMNLEGVSSPSNPFPFIFSPTCRFPLSSSVVQLVYSSHCFEHLNDATVEQLLRESRRVISPQGSLLLKLPDFELVKQAWKQKDTDFFKQWGIESVTPTWANRHVLDNFDNRAAMIFCGFWNKAYGDHFANRRNLKDGAYHGPPTMPDGRIATMISSLSPHAIAMELSDVVRSVEIEPTFNHQNAWDKSELEALLMRAGFKVETFDADDICRAYNDIPGILVHRDISIYCIAKPRS